MMDRIKRIKRVVLCMILFFCGMRCDADIFIIINYNLNKTFWNSWRYIIIT